MLTRTADAEWNDTECQDDSQGNSLVAGIEYSPDDVQFIGEILDQKEGATDRAVLDQPSNK